MRSRATVALPHVPGGLPQGPTQAEAQAPAVQTPQGQSWFAHMPPAHSRSSSHGAPSSKSVTQLLDRMSQWVPAMQSATP
jgi:hypothetical protein